MSETATLVNPVSAAQLKSRNQEPTHLGGSSFDDIGGTEVNSEPNTVKVDATKGVTTDTSIPKSVPAEPTHLKGVSEGDEDDVKVKFDEEDDDEAKLDEADDLDKAIKEALNDKPIDVKVNEEDDDDEDDEKKAVSEAADEDDDEKKAVAEGEDVVDRDPRSIPVKVSEEDDEKPEFLKGNKDKKVDEEADEDDEDKKKVDEADEGKPWDKKKVEEDDEDEDKPKKAVSEAVNIRVKMPEAAIFESAGFNAKQQKKVATLFESAIKVTTRQVTKKLNEAYKIRTARRIAESEQKLTDRLNTYLSVVVEQWVEDNRVNIRTSLRADLAENFLDGLQGLFKEHYIDVPESKVDVVETLTTELDELKAQINEQSASNLKLRRLAEAANKKRIVAEFARNMSETQAAKLAKLAENTDYVDAKDFREKLGMLKESYFGAPDGKSDIQAARLPEEDVQVVTEAKSGVKSEADEVVAAISRQVKSNW